MSRRGLIDRFRVRPGEKVRLADRDTTAVDIKDLRDLCKDALKARAQRIIQRNLAELAAAQDLLWASDVYSILVVLQAPDAAGKDGMIKHVMSGMNPQGCHVASFKQPSAEELDHDFLWRCVRELPRRGQIGIFNRSYYEEVLVVRVHPEILARQRLPPAQSANELWKARYESINDFERHLVRSGTVVVKLFLHVSRKEQKKRFLERLKDPTKQWKFSLNDVLERAHWEEYTRAYEKALSATSTKSAPWYIVPADQKWAARAIVATILSQTVRALHLAYPKITAEKRRELEKARRLLERE